jgi:hypothetical protein
VAVGHPHAVDFLRIRPRAKQINKLRPQHFRTIIYLKL